MALVLIGIVAVSLSAVSAGDKVTVDGNDFVLPDGANVWQEQNTLVNFKFDNGVKGLITSISGDSELSSYITNDTDTSYIVGEIDTNMTADCYAFADGLMDERGYFLIFQKNGQIYAFEMYDEGVTESSSSDNEFMAETTYSFFQSNDGLTAI